MWLGVDRPPSSGLQWTQRYACSDLRTILQLIPMLSIIDRTLSVSRMASRRMSRLTPSTHPTRLSMNASRPILIGAQSESCERSTQSFLFSKGAPCQAPNILHITWTAIGQGERPLKDPKQRPPSDTNLRLNEKTPSISRARRIFFYRKVNKKRRISVLPMTILIITNNVFSTFNIAVLLGTLLLQLRSSMSFSNHSQDSQSTQ